MGIVLPADSISWLFLELLNLELKPSSVRVSWSSIKLWTWLLSWSMETKTWLCLRRLQTRNFMNVLSFRSDYEIIIIFFSWSRKCFHVSSEHIYFFCYRHPQCRMKRCICWKYRCKVIHFTPKNPRRLWSKPFSRNRLSKQINQFIFPDRQVNTFKFIRFLFYLKECVHFMVLSYFSIIKITRYLVVISFFYCHLNAELFSHLFFSSKFQSFCIGR